MYRLLHSSPDPFSASSTDAFFFPFSYRCVNDVPLRVAGARGVRFGPTPRWRAVPYVQTLTE